MRAILGNLLKLQAAEQGVLNLQRQLGTLPEERTEREAKLAEERKCCEQAIETSRNAKIEADQLDLEIKTREAEIDKVQAKLNQAKSNAEYTAHTNQINNLKQEISTFEDKALALLENIEGLQDAARQVEQEFKAKEKVFKEFLAKVAEEEARIATEIETLKSQRVDFEKSSDPVVLQQYQQLMRYFSAHGGLVIVPVTRGVCQACGSKVLPNDEVKLIRAKELVRCKACSRIIYLPEKLATGG